MFFHVETSCCLYIQSIILRPGLFWNHIPFTRTAKKRYMGQFGWVLFVFWMFFGLCHNRWAGVHEINIPESILTHVCIFACIVFGIHGYWRDFSMNQVWRMASRLGSIMCNECNVAIVWWSGCICPKPRGPTDGKNRLQLGSLQCLQAVGLYQLRNCWCAAWGFSSDIHAACINDQIHGNIMSFEICWYQLLMRANNSLVWTCVNSQACDATHLFSIFGRDIPLLAQGKKVLPRRSIGNTQLHHLSPVCPCMCAVVVT